MSLLQSSPKFLPQNVNNQFRIYSTSLIDFLFSWEQPPREAIFPIRHTLLLHSSPESSTFDSLRQILYRGQIDSDPSLFLDLHRMAYQKYASFVQ